jgi:hypothetical protein
MLFNFNTAAALLAICGLASAHVHKRDTTTDIFLWAYGTNISGVNIFYGDGKDF